MFLEINEKLLKKRAVYEYIADCIEKKFPDSTDDANKIRNAKTEDEIEKAFGEYYEGWLFDGVRFKFGDIALILQWMDSDKALAIQSIQIRRYIEEMNARGIDITKPKKKRSDNQYTNQ